MARRRIHRTVLKRVKDKNKLDSEIDERLVACSKGDRDSIIQVGCLVENIIKGPFGSVLRALTTGRIDMELQGNKDGKLSADRILGRCEMGSTLWHDLETFVLEKDALLRPIKERKFKESSEAPEIGQDIGD